MLRNNTLNAIKDDDRVIHREIKGIREREREREREGEGEGGGRERKREVMKGVGKRKIFGDEKRWMEGQHAHGEKDVLLSIARERGGREGSEERREGVDKVEEGDREYERFTAGSVLHK